MADLCSEHSGCITDIQNLKDDQARTDKIVERIDAKLNMIIGAIAMAPFIWALLSGVVKIASAGV